VRPFDKGSVESQAADVAREQRLVSATLELTWFTALGNA